MVPARLHWCDLRYVSWAPRAVWYDGGLSSSGNDDDSSSFSSEDSSSSSSDDSPSSSSDDSPSSSSDDSPSSSSDDDTLSYASSEAEHDEVDWEGWINCESRHTTPQGRADGVALNNSLWPSDKHHLKVRFLNGDTWEKDTVKQIIKKHYHAIPMRIRFKFLEKGARGPSDIRITFTTWSASYIGRDAEDHRGKTTMWLNMHPSIRSPEERRLKRQADILHEFGHALGMEHEQSHPDCKANWNYRVLQARQGWDVDRVHNNYKKVDAVRARLAPYDPESIMHYRVQPGDTQSMKMHVPQNTVLSAGDKKFLMSIYPAEQTPEPKRKPKPAKKPTKKPDQKQVIRTDWNWKPGLKWEKKSDGRNTTVLIDGITAVVKGNHIVVSGSANLVAHGGDYVKLGIRVRS
jgi:hypothetical protein